MKVTWAMGGLTIESVDGTRQIVRFGRDGTHAAARTGGSIARVLEAAGAECPVILWDEAGEAPTAGVASGSG